MLRSSSAASEASISIVTPWPGRDMSTTRGCWTARGWLTFSIDIECILNEPGPVFVWLKVRPEIENKPIGSRSQWRTRSQVQVVMDLKQELGIAS